jgi:hypothetical protein
VGGNNLPTSRIRLEIFALSFQETRSYLLRKFIVPARVMNILSFSDRYTWIHKVLVILDEGIPFMVLWHGNRTSTQLLHRRISRICFTLQYTSVSIVRLLDFSNNDSLKFSPRGLEIEIRLFIQT